VLSRFFLPILYSGVDQLQLALSGGQRGGWVIHCDSLEAQDLSYTRNILKRRCDVRDRSYMHLIMHAPNVSRTTIGH